MQRPTVSLSSKRPEDQRKPIVNETTNCILLWLFDCSVYNWYSVLSFAFCQANKPSCKQTNRVLKHMNPLTPDRCDLFLLTIIHYNLNYCCCYHYYYLYHYSCLHQLILLQYHYPQYQHVQVFLF